MDPLPGSPKTPPELESKYVDWSWDVAWQYGPEALTYRLTKDSVSTRYLKIAPVDAFPSLEDEAKRLFWAVDYLPVPVVIERGSNSQISWLITRGLTGADATDPMWAPDPKRIVRILAEGLRRFHETSVQPCPFDFRLDAALAHVRRRLRAGRIQPDRDFHPEFEHLSAEAAVARLEGSQPDTDHLVVCHGDYCPPNIIVEEGVANGFVDLGELGVADRWWDLAVATWSVTWNFGAGYEDLFLECYGIALDPERIEFYRLLYDVVS